MVNKTECGNGLDLLIRDNNGDRYAGYEFKVELERSRRAEITILFDKACEPFV